MRIKQIIRLFLFLPLCYYIYISQKYENNISIRESINNKFLSEKISFDREGEVRQEVTDLLWPFKNRLDNELLLLSIKFDTVVDFSQSNLRFNISVNAKGKDSLLNRFIQHEFINNSEEVILRKHQMKADELHIGLIPNFISEDIVIKLRIIEADKILSKANPKFKIEAFKGSDGVYGFASLDVLIKNIVLVLSIICIVIYIVIGIKNETKKNEPFS